MALTTAGATLIGAGISALGSAASNIYNGVQSNNLNKTNREWQRENMYMQRNWAQQDWTRDAGFQRAMLKESQNFDAAEWSRRFAEENWYNDPKNQINRLRSAGINPFYATSMIDQGNAQGASSPGVTAQSAPNRGSISGVPNVANSFYPLDLGSSFDRFADSLMKKAQIENLQSQTKGNDLENVFKDAVFADRLFQYQFKSAEMKSMMPYLQQMAELNFRQANANLENSFANTSALFAHEQFERDQVTLEKNKFRLQQEMQAFNMSESKRMNNAQINNWAALTAMYGQQALLAKAQTWHEYWKGYNTILQGNGIYLDNQQKEWIQPYVLSMYQSNAAIAEEDAKFAPFKNSIYSKYIQPNLNPLLQGIGTFGGLYLGLKGMKGAPTPIKGFGR